MPYYVRCYTDELLREHLKSLEEDANVLVKYLADDTLVRREPGDQFGCPTPAA
ncbi:hypothetical protein [Haloplanus halobius]|uniref:hypothetical protein n=1 Tax=Haloplanus halobius TaxID=2934938 RepID=UPI00200E54BF|nr:hypothetical protein [Haloplanus sp. XH21]